jgi:hypothetical protein
MRGVSALPAGHAAEARLSGGLAHVSLTFDRHLSHITLFNNFGSRISCCFNVRTGSPLKLDSENNDCCGRSDRHLHLDCLGGYSTLEHSKKQRHPSYMRNILNEGALCAVKIVH